MANFRRNHTKQSKGKMATSTVKFAIIIGILVVLMMGGVEYLRNLNNDKSNIEYVDTSLFEYSDNGLKPTFNLSRLLPSNNKGTTVVHKYYTLSYVEKYEEAEWVMFEMSKEREYIKHVKRWKEFNVDPKVITGSATHRDYVRSGFDRGHLVPAHALGFNRQGMKESFYMSNICPQDHDFNTGIWRELEEQCGFWAKKYKHLYVMTGPLFEEEPKQFIGKNRVAVPKYFYKIIFADKLDSPQMIGYVMPNRDSNEDINNYTVSVDQIENRSGIDFFAQYKDKAFIENLEATFDVNFWVGDPSISKRRNKYKKSK